MTKHDVIAQLKNAQGEKSLRAFASEIGEDAAVLCKIYSGERDPSPACLLFLAIEKKITTDYFPVDK